MKKKLEASLEVMMKADVEIAVSKRGAKCEEKIKKKIKKLWWEDFYVSFMQTLEDKMKEKKIEPIH